MCIGCDPRIEGSCANHITAVGTTVKTYVLNNKSYFYVNEDVVYGGGHVCTITHPYPYPYAGDASAFAATIMVNTTRTIYILKTNSHTCYYESLVKQNFDAGFTIILFLSVSCCIALCRCCAKQRQPTIKPTVKTVASTTEPSETV
jgi:hypothetical protein